MASGTHKKNALCTGAWILPQRLVLVQAQATSPIGRAPCLSSGPHSFRHLPLQHPKSLLLVRLLSANNRVVVVGRSYGGLNLDLSLDLFPHKVALAIFLTAFLLDTYHRPSYDVELAKALMRPASFFVDDLAKANKFSEEGYGFLFIFQLLKIADIGLGRFCSFDPRSQTQSFVDSSCVAVHQNQRFRDQSPNRSSCSCVAVRRIKISLGIISERSRFERSKHVDNR
ncbi:hypothetical protein K1719_029543 [Acacia pycnantha]|nr:hypothetical protein K1719_029543 [Acacia pycnantha]